jgi:predicted phosphodiesterase
LRHLIFSDVHANLEALRAVLADAGRRGYDVALSLGDHVGYGANPNECIEVLAGLENFAALRGNHDAAVLDPGERAFFNSDAYTAIVHTAGLLNETSREFLSQLPLLFEENDLFLGVHATPSHPSQWGYILDAIEAEVAFQSMQRRIAFTGHSHVACIFVEGGVVKGFEVEDEIGLATGGKYIINVGSVGQPRDRDPRAPYVLFDDETAILRFYRVEYDWNKTSAKIINAGLPAALAQRILVGL